jgi:hypothetical protein
MALYFVEAVAATGVGVNIIRDQFFTIAPVPRLLRKVGYVGSVNAMDAGYSCLIGPTQVMAGFNTTGGNNIAPTADTDMLEVNEIIPANVPLSFPITTAGVTNQTVLALDIANLPPQAMRRGRR